MDFFHQILFAILQGASELFPVSSLGHAVVVPAILHWGIDQSSAAFLPFLVMLHLGTAIGMLLFFYRDWLLMLRGLAGLLPGNQNTAQRRLIARLIVATIPAVIIGLIVKKPVAALFASPMIACVFLIANAGLLLLGERLRARSSSREGYMSYQDAFIIGLFQCLAFLPGLSRSGAAIVGGLRCGLAHEGAAKFSFLMGTPIIFAASVLEIPKLARTHELHQLFGTAIIAAIIAGIVAFASTAFLMRYFRDHEAWALKPFAYYCAGFGLISFGLLALGL